MPQDKAERHWLFGQWHGRGGGRAGAYSNPLVIAMRVASAMEWMFSLR